MNLVLASKHGSVSDAGYNHLIYMSIVLHAEPRRSKQAVNPPMVVPQVGRSCTGMEPSDVPTLHSPC
jgi:hypothetical protein